MVIESAISALEIFELGCFGLEGLQGFWGYKLRFSTKNILTIFPIISILIRKILKKGGIHFILLDLRQASEFRFPQWQLNVVYINFPQTF